MNRAKIFFLYLLLIPISILVIKTFYSLKFVHNIIHFKLCNDIMYISILIITTYYVYILI